MTVFRGQMKIAKRNIGIIVMYFVIFAGVSIALQQSKAANDKSASVFSDYSVSVGIVDRDKSDLSNGIIEFLSKIHKVKVLEDDMGAIKESLYYFENDVILQIPKGLEENIDTAGYKIGVTEVPGYNHYMYIRSQINDVLNCIKSYVAAGYSIDEAFEKMSLQENSKISLVDINGNGGKAPAFADMFGFFPYICMAILGNVVGLMLACIRKKNIRKRMEASATSLKRQNFENILALILVGIAIWGAFLIVTIVFNGKEVINNENLPYYIVNSFVMMIVTLSMSFVVGVAVDSMEKINMIVTPLSLFVSFLGGVFVPLSILNDTVRKIAKFVPAYWYEEINNSLSEYASLPSDIVHEVWCGIGIQLLFAVVFLGIALAISRYKKQTK